MKSTKFRIYINTLHHFFTISNISVPFEYRLESLEIFSQNQLFRYIYALRIYISKYYLVDTEKTDLL
jgi:hypothetical protein